MNYLDCIVVSNNIFVCSFPNEILIVSCEVKDNNVVVNQANALIVNCNFLRNWFKIFDQFLTENDFVSTCIAYTNSQNVLKFTKNEFKLNISGHHLGVTYSFDKTILMEIMNAMSHMYIASLCLTPQCTLIFNALMCHFEVCPDYENTLTTIMDLTPANFLDLIKSILILYNLSENSFLICSTLIRHKSIIRYLYKLRCYSKKK